jgi:polyisoprenoid-binding protein YceI
MTQETATTTAAPTLPAGHWTIDAKHSGIEFGIKHLLITTVKGSFNDFEGSVDVGEDASVAATGVIKTESIDTNEPQRDAHLRSGDFFDAATFPEIRFRSTSVEHVDGNRFRVIGDLTIRDVTRPIELETELAGSAKDPWGNERIGLTLQGHLNPTDFGVDWNQELETGGNLVGDRVDFTANISAVKAG